MSKRIASRVLLIGWDGADWQMIRPLIAKGWMPTLARLIDEGVSGNLATIHPVLSPMLWNSIATGKRADKHGICGFVEPQPDRSGIRPVTSTSRKCKAIWNILSQSGLRSQIVSWFASHPAEPILGNVVSDRYVAQTGVPSPRRSYPAGTFQPASLEEQLAPLLVTAADLDVDALLPFVPRAAEIDQDRDDRLVKLAHQIAQAATVHAAACHLVEQESWDLTAVYYSAIDGFGHHFMPYHPPSMQGVSERDAQLYKDVMVGCYRFHDMMLESLLAYAGPDTTVLIVSDHGFHSGASRPSANAWDQPETWHRNFGIACVHGPGIRHGAPLYGAGLLDITPTILTLLGLPVGQDMDGRPWLEVLASPAQPDRIESWESVDGPAGMHAEDLREDPAAAAELIRQFVALGYIDPPSEDTEETIRKVLRDRKINLAVAVTSSLRAAAAIPLWQELCQEYPDELGFLVQLASCYLRLGEWDQCQRILERMGEPLRQSPYLRLMQAKLTYEREGEDDAIRLARDLQAEVVLETGILNRVGELLLQTTAWPEAESAFRRSLAENPDNPVAHDGLAQVLLRQEAFDQAAEHALVAVGLIHYYPAAHFHLGVALQRCGQRSEAICAFETCVTMGYELHQTHRHLADLFALTHDAAKARRHRELSDAYRERI